MKLTKKQLDQALKDMDCRECIKVLGHCETWRRCYVLKHKRKNK